MKLTKSELRRIIKEEIQNTNKMLIESDGYDMKNIGGGIEDISVWSNQSNNSISVNIELYAEEHKESPYIVVPISTQKKITEKTIKTIKKQAMNIAIKNMKIFEKNTEKEIANIVKKNSKLISIK